jgi:hypothetical protein
MAQCLCDSDFCGLDSHLLTLDCNGFFAGLESVLLGRFGNVVRTIHVDHVLSVQKS